ncbi:DMBT1 protein, partial [Psilopogon haemacephalus]|nr:DMBT1 protein [Psilopogon haemacephalus]
RCAGRVEVKYYQRAWGTVCDDSWDMKDAAVVCRQLGCGAALRAHSSAHFGPGSGLIWMSRVECNGSEPALADCRHTRKVQEICNHTRDAGVTCSGTGREVLSTKPLFACSSVPEFTGLRLVNGSTGCEGRVEVQVQGTWGSLCDSHWDLLDAHVLCRHLNCG